MLQQLLNRIRGIDPFYEDIKTKQVALYQHCFDLVIDAIDLENNTNWALGENYDKAILQRDDEAMCQLVRTHAEGKGLSGCYMQVMVNQYFFADLWMREMDRDDWANRVLHRKKVDYFPSGWAIFKVIQGNA